MEDKTPYKSRELKLITLGFVIVLLLFAFAFSSVQMTEPVRATISPVHVEIVDFAFSPSNITVVIGVNNTVVWANMGAVDHTVTSNSGLFASGPLAPGKTFTFNFTTSGTFGYHCSIHPFMMGMVTVKGTQTSTTTRSTTASTTTNPAPTACSPSTCVNVTIEQGAHVGGLGYSPDTITVVAGVNATVVWTNKDTAVHTVTSIPGDPANFSSSESPGLSPGGTYKNTFTKPGTYVYHCIYHTFMVGIVIVKPSTASTTGSTLNISCNHNSVVVGTTVTCKATVKGSGRVPTGTVAWTSSQPIKPSNTSCKLSSGACSVKITTLLAGSSGLLANYGGDPSNSPSSGAYILTGSAKATKTTVSCKPGSAVAGSSTTITCTAKVKGYSPTGTVSWSQSGLGAVSFMHTTCVLSSGTCFVTLTGSSSGQVTITASYPGDPNNLGGSGTAKLAIKATT